MHTDEHTHKHTHACTHSHTHTTSSFISPQVANQVCFSPNFHSSLLSTHTHAHTHINVLTPPKKQVDSFPGIRVKGILSNLSSLISLLTHVYQRRDPRGYLGNQTGSVGGQGFQVLLLSSLCFPLVTLQEQTQQQQQQLITR